MATLICGSSPTNVQIWCFDRYNAHWDPDILDYLANNNVESFFLKSNDSKNNQPYGNGYNALVKSKYNKAKLEWDNEFVSIKYSPPHMNSVIYNTWMKTQMVAAPINYSFKKTKLVPLTPPTNKKFVNHAFLSRL